MNDCSYYYEQMSTGEMSVPDTKEILSATSIVTQKIRELYKEMELPCSEWFSLERYSQIKREIADLKSKLTELLAIVQATIMIQIEADPGEAFLNLIDGFSIETWAIRNNCPFLDLPDGIEYPPEPDMY